jgi:hypothetical protein
MTPATVVLFGGLLIVAVGVAIWAIKKPEPNAQNTFNLPGGFGFTLNTPAIAVMAMGVIVMYLGLNVPAPQPADPERPAASNQPQTQVPSPPATPSRPINGAWNILMACPSGAAVNEQDAHFSSGRYARAFDNGSGTKGSTELSMGFRTDQIIHVLGYVMFEPSFFYPIDATGTRTGANSFVGMGRFGSESQCKLSVTGTN